MIVRDRERRNAYDRQYRVDHPDRARKAEYDRANRGTPRRHGQILEAGRRRHAVLRAWLTEQKRKPCSDCGRLYPPECMDFDHVGAKYRTISALLHSSKEKMLVEIAQCELVCANCHRVRTSTRLRAKAVNAVSSHPLAAAFT